VTGRSAVRELDVLGPILGLRVPLPEICSLAEVRLMESVTEVVQDVVTAAPFTAQRTSNVRFALEGTVFEIRIREAVSDSETLYVQIGEVGARWSRKGVVKARASIRGAGQYSLVAIRLDRRLGAVAERLAQALQAHFESEYRRLEAHVVGALLSAQHQLATRLYVELRSVLPEDVAARVGLYGLLEDGRALYFLDPPAIQAALRHIARSRPSVAASPLELTSLLVRGWVRFEETFAKTVLVEDRPMEFTLEDLRYTTVTGYDLAERGLYGTTDVICHPLVREGQVRLVAGYPLRLREQVDPKLERLEPRFRAIVSEYASSIRALVGVDRLLPERHWTVSRFAELLGRFTGGFVDALD
jgi:hypothetical protein